MSVIVQRRLGRSLILLTATLLVLDALMQFALPVPLVDEMRRTGFSPDLGPRIAAIALACSVLVAMPPLAPVGALLTTAFLGGAICAHFRLGEVASPPQLVSVATGLCLWLGLALADDRVRQLFDWRQPRDEERGR